MKIVIAGAGLAGLHAAWRLDRAGHDVTIVEAKNRVGGRSWSHKLENGVTVERGGEFIAATEFPIRALAAELEIPLINHGGSFARRELQGETVTADEIALMTSRLRACLETMVKDGETDVSLNDVFESVVGPDYVDDPIYRRWATSRAGDPKFVSAAGTIYRQSHTKFGYLEHDAHAFGGNQSIAGELARRLHGKIRLESPVTSVEQDSKRVRFEIADGHVIEGDAGILAVPLPLLRELKLGFQLPDTMNAALDNMFMGVAAKLSSQTAEGPASRSIQDQRGFWWAWNSLSGDGIVNVPAVTAFGATPDTLDGLALTDGGAKWLARLRELRPDLEFVGEALLTDWRADVWTKGSYSAPGLGWRPEHLSAFDALAGRIALAGEHTVAPSTMSGAVYSGGRAAALLTSQLG